MGASKRHARPLVTALELPHYRDDSIAAPRGSVLNEQRRLAARLDCQTTLREAAGEYYMLIILLVILLLLALGSLPTWPYSRAWGYYPSSGLGLVVVILLVLLLLGRI